SGRARSCPVLTASRRSSTSERKAARRRRPRRRLRVPGRLAAQHQPVDRAQQPQTEGPGVGRLRPVEDGGERTAWPRRRPPPGCAAWHGSGDPRAAPARPASGDVLHALRDDHPAARLLPRSSQKVASLLARRAQRIRRSRRTPARTTAPSTRRNGLSPRAISSTDHQERLTAPTTESAVPAPLRGWATTLTRVAMRKIAKGRFGNWTTAHFPVSPFLKNRSTGEGEGAFCCCRVGDRL